MDFRFTSHISAPEDAQNRTTFQTCHFNRTVARECGHAVEEQAELCVSAVQRGVACNSDSPSTHCTFTSFTRDGKCKHCHEAALARDQQQSPPPAYTQPDEEADLKHTLTESREQAERKALEDEEAVVQRLLQETREQAEKRAQEEEEAAVQRLLQQTRAQMERDQAARERSFENDTRRVLRETRAQVQLDNYNADLAVALRQSNAADSFRDTHDEEEALARVIRQSAAEYYQNQGGVMYQSQVDWHQSLDPHGQGRGRREVGLEEAMGNMHLSANTRLNVPVPYGYSAGYPAPQAAQPTPSASGRSRPASKHASSPASNWGSASNASGPGSARGASGKTAVAPDQEGTWVQSEESRAMGALRAQQNAAYAASLAADKEKARKKQAAEDARKNAELDEHLADQQEQKTPTDGARHDDDVDDEGDPQDQETLREKRLAFIKRLGSD